MGEGPRLREPKDHVADLRLHCDVVVVGSGPAGAIAAWRLASAGVDVVLLEAGPWVRTFQPDVGRTLASSFWDGGVRVTRGNVLLPTLQARCLGGGSVYNSAICMRPTTGALARWRDAHGIDFTSGELDADFDAVERLMGVKPVAPDVMGRRNELFLEAAKRLGWAAEVIQRNEEGCQGSANCILGCRVGAKLSMDRRSIPEAMALGARVVTGAVVDRLLLSRGRARGVEGHLINEAGESAHALRVTAKATVLAAGTIATPALMRRSGLRKPGIGDNLRFHPSTYLLGRFDSEILPWQGATQGAHTTEFLDRGIKLESLWADPAVFSIRFPVEGLAFQEWMARWPQIAVWDGWVSGDDSVGAVREVGPRLDLTWNFGARDVKLLQETNALLAEMFRAAGAREVLPGMRGLPAVLSADDAPERIRAARVTATDLPTASNHVFGATPMGADPATAATDKHGAVYGTEDLYVVDTGLFPESPGVNPMLTAMALAHAIGGTVADRVASAARAP